MLLQLLTSDHSSEPRPGVTTPLGPARNHVLSQPVKCQPMFQLRRAQYTLLASYVLSCDLKVCSKHLRIILQRPST